MRANYTGREGYGRYHYQENIQFCRQSRGSLCELIDDFNDCFDEGYIDEKYCMELKEDGYTLIKVLNGHIVSLKRLKKTYDQSTKVGDVWPT